MGICYSLWKLPGREVGAHTHLLARLSQVSEGGGPGCSASLSQPQCQRANFSLLVWKMFGFVLRKKGEKSRREKPGCGGSSNARKGGKKNPNPQNNQIQPQVQHYRRTKKSKDGAAHQAGNWCALPPSPLLLWTRRRRGFQAPKPRSFLILWGSLTLLEPGGREKRERKSHKN